MPRRPRLPEEYPLYLKDTIYGRAWVKIRGTLEAHEALDESPIRAVVDALIEKGPRVAVEVFNRRYGTVKIPVTLVSRELRGEPVAVPDRLAFTGEEEIAEALRELLLSPDSYRRLKRCPECHRYFFDTTKRSNAVHDRKSCTDQALARKYKASQSSE